MVLQPQDSLWEKASAPIQPGNIVYGYLVAAFKTVSDAKVLAGGMEIILTFDDVFQHHYVVDQEPHIVLRQNLPIMVLPGMHIEVH
jgi:hypothetical protein